MHRQTERTEYYALIALSWQVVYFNRLDNGALMSEIDTGGGANVGRDARAGRDFTGRDHREQEFNFNLRAEEATRADLYRELQALFNLFYDMRGDVREVRAEVRQFNNLIGSELKSLRNYILFTAIALALAVTVGAYYYRDLAIHVNELQRQTDILEGRMPTATPWYWPGVEPEDMP